jgi:hypothetical protein
MKRERAQLSAKNPCHIPKHRYYELKHFCLQYPDWKKALVLLDGWNTEPRGIPGIIKGRPPESPTERQAIARLYYSGQIAIVDRCIEKLDPTLAPFILKGVTEGIGFEKLQAARVPLLPGNVLRILQIFLLAPEQGTAVTRKNQLLLWKKMDICW